MHYKVANDAAAGATPISADDVLKQLTLEEKVSICGASDWWRTVPIHRGDSLLLPHIKMTDGPNGARGESYVSGIKAACFPCAESIAASFDEQIAYHVGKEVALEAKTKSADVLLAPTVCLVRSPLGGRNHETYGEDPHVLGTMGAAYVNGCQSVGVGATPKHFVANEVEQRRRFVSAEVEERALREIYLKPFQIIMKYSDPWCLMSSYNKLNGTYCSEDKRLLTTILREEWGFKGLITSDWVGTYSTVRAMEAGLDIEMPAPLVFRGERLLKAVKDGKVSEEILDERARKVIELIQRTNRFQDPEDKPERYLDSPRRDEFIAQAAAEGIVLLKNENNALPLRKGTKVLVVGQHASLPPVGGGGSARVPAEHIITPVDALKAAGVEFAYEKGPPVYGAVPVPVTDVMSPTGDSQQPGAITEPVRLEWFNGSNIGDNLAKDEMIERSEYMIKEKWPTFLDEDYCTRMTFDLTPETTGNHTFTVVTTGIANLYIDGKKIYHREQEPVLQRESFYFFRPKLERPLNFEMQAGKRYTITLEAWATPPDIAKGGVGGEVVQGSAVGFIEFFDVDAEKTRVTELAATCDVALVFTGTTHEIESEGFDRTTMDLKSLEYEFIKAVAAANPKTVIVNNSGSPVSLHQVHDKVAGIVQAFFPGQETGTSIASVLTGEVNPSGSLPVTWPMYLEDNPAHGNWPGDENDIIRYEEGIFLGYRHYDRPDAAKPLFPFGHGLSYTTFGNVSLNVRDGSVLGKHTSLEVSCSIANTGTVAGKVVVQFYVRRLSSAEAGTGISKFTRPVKELKAFRKVHLEPAAYTEIQVPLDKYAVSIYDAEGPCWRAEEGTYEVMAAFSAENIVAAAKFQVSNDFTWVGL